MGRTVNGRDAEATRRTRRTLAGSVMALALVATLASPVVAAPPPNDDRGAASVVSSLPFQDDLDTSEATMQGADPDCWEEEPLAASVWYSFTPPADGWYGVSTAGSSYPAVVQMGFPTGGGGFDLSRCSWPWEPVGPGLRWFGQAGQEYLFMAAAWGQAGGELLLRVVADPPAVRFPIASIKSEGVVTRQGGARIAGRLACLNVVSRQYVHIQVKQRIPGKGRVNAYGFKRVRCGQDWSAIAGSAKKFRRGPATAIAIFQASNDFEYQQADVTRRITLK